MEERENVDDSLINFSADHRDIILNRFGATLPPCFKEVTNKEVTNKDSDNEIKKRKKTKKQKKEAMKQEKKKGHNRDSELAIKNKQQCKDFKMRVGKQWSIFAGSSLKDQAKLNGLPMCGHWHSRDVCFLDCKKKASHVKCSEIPADVKETRMKWMKKICRKE